MTLTSLLGLAAAACTTLAFVPQAARSWRTGSTRDISLGMFVVMTTGVLLWLVYGLLIRDLPLVLANGATFLLSLSILVLKIRKG
ncbi:MAG TPA: SemiSWEET transporter [Candidatus Saccharimonadales bacterium]|nr:SemiSWEET transporter [Candidatus Saccharimonadales bacterium]